jgi:hypothetical protein
VFSGLFNTQNIRNGVRCVFSGMINTQNIRNAVRCVFFEVFNTQNIRDGVRCVPPQSIHRLEVKIKKAEQLLKYI